MLAWEDAPDQPIKGQGRQNSPGDAQRSCSNADGYAQGWGLQLERRLYFVTKLDGLIFFFLTAGVHLFYLKNSSMWTTMNIC